MAIIRGKVTLYGDGSSEPLAEGMIYLHLGMGGQAQGTISPLAWFGDGSLEEDRVPGRRYKARFDDGREFDIILTRYIFTACGPEVLRFTAADPQAAALLKPAMRS